MPPVPPVEMRPFGMVGLFLDGSEPEIPVEVFRRGGEFLEAFLAPVATPDPDVHFADFPDRPGPDQFHHAPVVSAGVNLGAELGGQPGFAGQLGHHSRLGNGAGQRLLAVEVPSAAQGRHARHGVGVIRGGHHDGVEILLVHQPPEVPVGLCSGELFRHRSQAVVVDIAESRDVGDVLELADTESRLPVRTNEPDVEAVVGGHFSLGPQNPGRGPGACDHSGGPLQEVATARRGGFHHLTAS